MGLRQALTGLSRCFDDRDKHNRIDTGVFVFTVGEAEAGDGLMSTNYKQTQMYKLGKQYKRLGKMLMDEKTDLRDLVAAAHDLGIDLQFSVKRKCPPDDEYALAA